VMLLEPGTLTVAPSGCVIGIISISLAATIV
jgi:hypothetical protein